MIKHEAGEVLHMCFSVGEFTFQYRSLLSPAFCFTLGLSLLSVKYSIFSQIAFLDALVLKKTWENFIIIHRLFSYALSPRSCSHRSQVFGLGFVVSCQIWD